MIKILLSATNKKRFRIIGFLKRLKTKKGKIILKNRRKKKRYKLINKIFNSSIG